jgi:hypothetical protein
VLRVLIFVVLPVALLIAGVWYVAANPERLLDVDGEQLGSSLARETPEPGGGTCSRDRGRHWTCNVETDPERGSARTYQLTTDGDGCWEARPRGASGERLSGCVNLWDYAWPARPASED